MRRSGVAPEQQLSVLDVAFAHVVRRLGGEIVFGFVPVEITDGGIAKIDNYYASGDDPRLIARFLQEIVRCYHRDYTIRSVTLTRHAEVFRAEGFVPVRELEGVRGPWNTGKTAGHERLTSGHNGG